MSTSSSATSTMIQLLANPTTLAHANGNATVRHKNQPYIEMAFFDQKTLSNTTINLHTIILEQQQQSTNVKTKPIQMLCSYCQLPILSTNATVCLLALIQYSKYVTLRVILRRHKEVWICIYITSCTVILTYFSLYTIIIHTIYWIILYLCQQLYWCLIVFLWSYIANLIDHK